ncbi:hypothetical protein BC937DRAFT_93802 [Endogone sp. FLAS-F59071]|nr:hypothetical protein BC937DRAFT_93802 [Endogone sp. FLAS-F59071]|eukprot:RUS21036.1 hypothetical protein BC937DRAFT_93802 [Endogone sp. FLAS-F59071]
MPPPTSSSIPNQTSATDALVLFTAGLLSALAAYSVFSHVRDTQTKRILRRDPFSGNPKRLEDNKYLPDIIKACQSHQNPDTRLRGVTTLQLLSRNDAGALEVLVELLRATDLRETAQKYAAVAICDLVQLVDERKIRIVHAGVLEPLECILTSETIHNNELKYWSLMVVHQISLCDNLHHALITAGFVPLLARMSRLTFGNTNMPKYCMQSLVRIINSTETIGACDIGYNENEELMGPRRLDNEGMHFKRTSVKFPIVLIEASKFSFEAKTLLEELLDYNIVSLISVCLRSDDVELIYWASGLMHEYVVKDVSQHLFRQIKGVQTILLTLLGADEVYISRVVLRTIKAMAQGQDTFQLEMIRIGLVKKIMHCLASDDDDTRYWATACLKEVVSQAEAHEEILDAPELPTLFDIANLPKLMAAGYVAEIFFCICRHNSNYDIINKHAVVIIDGLNRLLAWEESEVHEKVISSLTALMSMTEPPLIVDEMAHRIITACFENFIAVVLDSERDNMQLMCSKALLVFAIRDPTLIPRLRVKVIEPLIKRVTEVGSALISPFFQILVTSPLVLPSAISVSSVPRSSLAHPTVSASSAAFPRLDNEPPIHSALTASDTSSFAPTVMPPPRSSSLQPRQANPSVRRQSQVGPSPLRQELIYETSPSASPYPFHNPELVNSLNASGSLDFPLRPMFQLPATAAERLICVMKALKTFVDNKMVFSSVIVHLEGREDVEVTEADASDEQGGVDENNDLGEEAKAIIAMLEEGEESRTDLNQATLNKGPDAQPKEDDTMPSSFLASVTQTRLNPSLRDLAEVLCHFAVLPVVDTWAREFGIELVDDEEEIMLDSSVARRKLLELTKAVAIREMDGTNTVKVQGHYDTMEVASDSISLSEITGTGTSGGLYSEEDNNGGAGTHLSERDNEFVRKTIGMVAIEALRLLASLVRLGPVRHYLIQDQHFLPIMLRLFRKYRTTSETVMMTLGLMIPLGYATRWSSAEIEVDLETDTQGRVIKEKATERNHDGFVEWSMTNRTDSITVGYDRLELRNDSSSFQTIRATHSTPVSAPTPRKYAYEIMLRTEGIVQFGWAAPGSLFDPDCGNGVGDDNLSYGYDPFRSKKWHGRLTDECPYGSVWAAGDVLTTAIDLDEGTIRYYLDENDMGIAFEGIDSQLEWFPALSIDAGQGCRVSFGGVLDPMQYIPDTYRPIASVLDLTSHNEIEEPAGADESIDQLLSTDTLPEQGSTTARKKNGKGVNQRYLLEPSSVPSLYFEVTIGMGTGDKQKWVKSEIKSPTQIGAFDEQGRLLSVIHGTRLGGPSALLICQVSLDALSEGNAARVLTECMEKGEHAEVKNLAMESLPHMFTLKDGDVVGILFERELRVVGLVVNAVVIAQISLRDHPSFASFAPVVPHIANVNKYILNVGQEPFVYHPGNTMIAVDKVVRYLDG